MAPKSDMSKLPREVWDIVARDMTFPEWIKFWSSDDEIRQQLYAGPAVVEHFIPHSKEDKLAKKKYITHKQALLRTHTRREGFALAMPYSMALLADGWMRNSLCYSDGILCYIHEDLVRILDVHGASQTEDVIDMVKLMAEIPEYRPDIDNVGIILRYENGILLMKLKTEIANPQNDGNPILVAIDVRRDFVSTPQSPSRIRKILRRHLPQHPFHVMTDGSYLVCADTGVPAWTLKCYDLSKKEEKASIIALHTFLPRGEECWFKLLDGWVYAICRNENGPYRGDRKKQLYYNCCRFPIDNFGPAEKPEDFLGPSQYTPLPARLQAVKVPRGSGEFDWQRVCVDLVKDEETGELLIVESPSITESPESDRPYRLLTFPDPEKHEDNPWGASISDIVKIMDVPSSSAHPAHQPSRYDTKLESVRKCIQPSQSIMDVTFEDLGGESVLHLYASSTDRGVWRFPPESAPHELCNFLTREGNMIASADERSLIVFILGSIYNESGSTDTQLILVNFDSGINFPGFKHMALEHLSDKESDGKDLTDTSRPEDLRELQVKMLYLNEEASKSNTTTREVKALVPQPGFSTEPAKHRTINQGFHFYPATPPAE